MRHRDEIDDLEALPDMLALVFQSACHGVDPEDHVVPLLALRRYKELLIELLAHQHFKLDALLLISQEKVSDPDNLEVVPVGAARAHLAVADGWLGHGLAVLRSLASSGWLTTLVWRTSSLCHLLLQKITATLKSHPWITSLRTSLDANLWKARVLMIWHLLLLLTL